MTETIFEKNVFAVNFRLLTLVHVPSAKMEEEGFMTYTAACHQVAIEMLHFGETSCRPSLCSIYVQK